MVSQNTGSVEGKFQNAANGDAAHQYRLSYLRKRSGPEGIAEYKAMVEDGASEEDIQAFMDDVHNRPYVAEFHKSREIDPEKSLRFACNVVVVPQ